jgi:predicted O-methyltransferase YrrM
MERYEANVRLRHVQDMIKSMTVLFLAIAFPTFCIADAQLDARVKTFLEQRRGTWRDLNVPYEDGKILHDLIVERKFTRAFEIGTSTGHSTIWIAWALSKTGGKLTTVEIDPARQEQAKANVAAAGLSQYVEFILGDAHKIVPAAQGRYDFIFSDADKDWYIRYFDALYPKLTDNACFTAHNVEESRFGFTRGWIRDYLEHVRRVPDMETFIHPDSRAGVAITCKKTA